MADKIITSINLCLELETLTDDSLILLKACVNFSYSSVVLPYHSGWIR